MPTAPKPLLERATEAAHVPTARLQRLKPRSSLWRTTWVVTLVVVASLAAALWLVWHALYLPEIRQHAVSLSRELALKQFVMQQIKPEPLVYRQAPSMLVVSADPPPFSFDLVKDPTEFPSVQSKFLVSFLTDQFAKTLEDQLGEPVTAYFKFKPEPVLWVYYPSLGQNWVRQPLPFYNNYDPAVAVSLLVLLPLLSFFAVLILVRQLNRPLERLKSAAQQFLKNGSFAELPTHTGPVEIRQVNRAFNHLFETLERNESERSLMLAGISHDLRTPLTRMRLSAEFMPEDLKEGLVYDIDDMDGILEQFISFMKDGSDEQVQPTSLESILHEVKVQFAPLHLEVQAPDLPKIPLRPLSIKRLIVNLVNNAVRYGAEPIWVLAYLSYAEDSEQLRPKHVLNIVVRDEGEGADESTLDQLMEPFHRGEAARTTQGSGLGLAIVQRIARQHGGTLTLKNRKTKGLEAKVSIPWERDVAQRSSHDKLLAENFPKHVVVQEDLTGCGFAAVANLTGKSYEEVKAEAARHGIVAQDPKLFSDSDYVVTLLNHLGSFASNKRQAFVSWEQLPSSALLATKVVKKEDSASWHWVAFFRKGSQSYLIDSDPKLESPVITDFKALTPEFYIEVLRPGSAL